MWPTWVLSAPDGPHDGPMNLAIRASLWKTRTGGYCWSGEAKSQGISCHDIDLSLQAYSSLSTSTLNAESRELNLTSNISMHVRLMICMLPLKSQEMMQISEINWMIGMHHWSILWGISTAHGICALFQYEASLSMYGDYKWKMVICPSQTGKTISLYWNGPQLLNLIFHCSGLRCFISVEM